VDPGETLKSIASSRADLKTGAACGPTPGGRQADFLAYHSYSPPPASKSRCRPIPRDTRGAKEDMAPSPSAKGARGAATSAGFFALGARKRGAAAQRSSKRIAQGRQRTGPGAGKDGQDGCFAFQEQELVVGARTRSHTLPHAGFQRKFWLAQGLISLLLKRRCEVTSVRAFALLTIRSVRSLRPALRAFY